MLSQLNRLARLADRRSLRMEIQASERHICPHCKDGHLIHVTRLYPKQPTGHEPRRRPSRSRPISSMHVLVMQRPTFAEPAHGPAPSMRIDRSTVQSRPSRDQHPILPAVVPARLAWQSQLRRLRLPL